MRSRCAMIKVTPLARLCPPPPLTENAHRGTILHMQTTAAVLAPLSLFTHSHLASCHAECVENSDQRERETICASSLRLVWAGCSCAAAAAMTDCSSWHCRLHGASNLRRRRRRRVFIPLVRVPPLPLRRNFIADARPPAISPTRAQANSLAFFRYSCHYDFCNLYFFFNYRFFKKILTQVIFYFLLLKFF